LPCTRAGCQRATAFELQRFGSDVNDLQAGKLQQWARPYERLAAIILADQFTR
jgi:uncharacterized protein (DUF924 family)